MREPVPRKVGFMWVCWPARVGGEGSRSGSVASIHQASTPLEKRAVSICEDVYKRQPYYSYRKALPDERKWQIGDVLYVSHGNHSLAFGVDGVHNYDLQNNTYESNGYISYSYVTNFLADMNSEGKAADSCNSTAAASGTSTTSALGTYPCYSSFAQGFGACLLYTSRCV